MVITFSIILLGALVLFRPLQKNSFYILHAAIIILSAYYIETPYFRTSAFAPKTLLLFVVFQLVSINIVTIVAYYVDKRAAIKGKWRVPEFDLHTLEFLGGWAGALLAQKMFRHKTKKKSYQSTFIFLIFAELACIIFIIKYLFY